ncbi:MAG: spermidine synthase [Acidobacteriota bacterium]
MRVRWSDELPFRDAHRLAILSFVFLYYELACIRWASAFVLYMSYYANIVLLACFLGMGLGMLAARRSRTWINAFPLSMFLFLGLTYFFEVQAAVREEGVIYFYSTRAPFQTPAEVAVGGVFVLVTVQFMLLSQEIGRLFARLAPLRAYAVNIGASLVGILAFALCSWLSLPAASWLAPMFLLLIPVLPAGRLRLANAVVLLAAFVLVFVSDLGARWSPYYRLTYKTIYPDGTHPCYFISVNGIQHQSMQPNEYKEPFYRLPYVILGDASRYRRVLVIGAGSGSDVAFALLYGAERVQAVEIDPGIVRLGRELHPERPYSDSRVVVTVNDARDFLRHTHDTYDLVVFGLPDSLTLTSAVANLRLESYLFTRECFEAVKARLAPSGVVILYNRYRRPWLVDKLGRMLTEVFGSEPRIFLWANYGYLATLVAGPGSAHLLDPPGPWMGVSPNAPPSAHDDWPFLYLFKPSLPPIYMRFGVFVIIISVLGIWLIAPPGTLRSFDPPLALMGAAFMLLETSAVVRLSLLFGGTWRVNAAVFTGVLVMVLVAVGVRSRIGPVRRVWWFSALFASLLAVGLLPVDRFSDLPGGGWLAAAVTMVPIMIANVVFADRFAESAAPHVGLASNVLGAIAGGLMEYGSMLFGYQVLLIPVAILYAAVAAWPRRSAGTGS